MLAVHDASAAFAGAEVMGVGALDFLAAFLAADFVD